VISPSRIDQTAASTTFLYIVLLFLQYLKPHLPHFWAVDYFGYEVILANILVDDGVRLTGIAPARYAPV
jgi:hypothetical protein